MPQHSSPRKRLRRDARVRFVNKSRIGRIRTFVKSFEDAFARFQSGSVQKDHVEAALKKTQSELSRGAARGRLHRKTASRKISRLMSRLRGTSSGSPSTS